MAQAKARFQGAVAFKNKQAAIQLGVVVNSLLDKMVTIFGEAKMNPQAPKFLEEDVRKLVALCENFLESAKTDRGARDSEDAIFLGSFLCFFFIPLTCQT